MEIVVVLLVVAVIWLFLRSQQQQRQLGHSRPRVTAADVDAARRAAEEDVTRFGEELGRLDGDVALAGADEALLQDWQRALDSYESARQHLLRLRQLSS